MTYAHSWWRRPWIAPLIVVVVAFVAFSLPPYLTGDPALSRIPPSGPAYYGLLVGHVVFGSVAILACCLQVWPWLRRRHPVVHRRVGRAYVFAGVLPAGLCAAVIAWFAPFGPVTAASSVVLSALWVGCTVAGWRAARQRRFADHRRWMVRSFVLTLSIITNRIWSPIFVIGLLPRLDTTFHGDMDLLVWVASGVGAWLGWVIPFLVGEAWLERTRRRPAPQPSAAEPTRQEVPV